MERPRNEIPTPEDEYDHELTQLQTDAIALTDELLKHKPEGSTWTFVDIVLVGDHDEMYEEIKNGPMAHLLAAPDENLAMESDGSYYPVIDLRKENTEFTGMRLTAWGWDYDKIRYTSDRNDGPPYEYKEYPGEKDKTRQLEIGMGFRSSGRDGYATESLSVYVSSSKRDYIYASSQLSMPAYAETGYEGHGGKHDDEISDEALEWFLDFVARHVGDEPKSTHELMDEKMERVRAKAQELGILDAVNNLVETTWDAQALYIMRKPMIQLDGKSILQCFDDPEMVQRAGEAANDVAARWSEGSWGEVFVKTHANSDPNEDYEDEEVEDEI